LVTRGETPGKRKRIKVVREKKFEKANMKSRTKHREPSEKKEKEF
jgi:hypothetical protein